MIISAVEEITIANAFEHTNFEVCFRNVFPVFTLDTFCRFFVFSICQCYFCPTVFILCWNVFVTNCYFRWNLDIVFLFVVGRYFDSILVLCALKRNIFDLVWCRLLIGRRTVCGDFHFRRLNVAGPTLVVFSVVYFSITFSTFFLMVEASPIV